jgi:anti-sigma factor RsiW
VSGLTCSEARELAQPWLDEALGPDRRELLDLHVAACAACREELEELASLRRALRSLPHRELPPEDLDQIFGRTVDRPRARSGRWKDWRWAAVAAAMLAGALLVPWIAPGPSEDGSFSEGVSDARARRAVAELRGVLGIASEAIRRGGGHGLETAIERGVGRALGGRSARATRHVLENELVPPVSRYSLTFWTRIPESPEHEDDGS